MLRVEESITNSHNLVLKLSTRKNGINLLKRFIDGSYQVHQGLMNQMVIVSILGNREVYNSSIKQTTNVRSATDTALVAAHNTLS